jgi:hypothetical protein
MEIELTRFVGPSRGRPMQLRSMDEENGENEGGQLTAPAIAIAPAPAIPINRPARPLTRGALFLLIVRFPA